jgi:hypothetical protein
VVPVQLSCHVAGPGTLEHRAWLTDGRDDPRETFARALIAACGKAQTILAYNAPSERRCISGLIDAVPRFSAALSALSNRLTDLLPIVRDHVYHPDFGGSFSIKDVLPALAPDLGYDDLEIQDGESASVVLEGLLLRGNTLDPAERGVWRRKLLRYCERDTLAMVRVLERLRKLADT